MRILNVMFNKGVGGVEQVFSDTTHLFLSWGWSTYTLTHVDAQSNAPLANMPLQPSASLTLRPNVLLPLLSTWKLRRFARKHAIDLVLIHNGKYANFVCRALKHLPRVGYAHGTAPKNLHGCDHIITLTDTMKAQFLAQNFPKSSLTTLPHALDCTLYSLPSSRLFFPDGKVRLGYLGRIERAKGIDTLIQAVSKLKSDNLDISLILAGSGRPAYLHKVKQSIHTQGLTHVVAWEGWIGDKKDFFSKIDILILPSHSESFGLVILEAFAHGVPVIASDTDGPMSIITPNHDGFIFPRAEENSLAATVNALIHDPHKLDACARNAFDTLHTRYDTSNSQKTLRALLEKILRKKQERKPLESL
ncbi:MAG: glycosyltransferase family 4 protein [Alphaproteobacteria bacterium]|nr:MAG: glycosyltransferase family 4 protein [Alphaproteobacteria bacterium]